MDLAQKLNQENFKSLAFKDIKKYLIANFLFKGDLESINILIQFIQCLWVNWKYLSKVCNSWKFEKRYY